MACQICQRYFSTLGFLTLLTYIFPEARMHLDGRCPARPAPTSQLGTSVLTARVVSYISHPSRDVGHDFDVQADVQHSGDVQLRIPCRHPQHRSKRAARSRCMAPSRVAHLDRIICIARLGAGDSRDARLESR
jgi:hypothetical protein